MSEEFPVREFLQMWAELFKKLPPNPRLVYRGFEALVLAEGVQFLFAPLPKGVPLRSKGECFKNAYQLVQDQPSRFVYVEGFAMATNLPIAVLHAWGYDRKMKRVVDPTWPDGQDYFGIPMDRGFVQATIVRREKYGVIDDPEGRFPLLRMGMSPKDKEKL